MKIQLLTVFTDPNVYGLHKLQESLSKHGWDFVFLKADEWKGFGTKLLTVYEYLKTSDIDAFIFCDAYDVVALGSIGEVLDDIQKKYGLSKMVFSSERGCWPIPDYNKYYEPQFEHGYNFLNSGLYYAPKEEYIKLLESRMPKFSDDDQLYFTEHFLFNEKSNIVLDNNCEVFQSYSFIGDNDYGYGSNRITNLKTGTQPILIHGNGRSDLTPIYNLI